MNTAEHIVESYFRLCRGCFTRADLKVEGGVGRQFDLLAYNIKNDEQFHIEVGVTHRMNWCPSIDQLTEYFEKKFCGVPPKRKDKSSGTTDFEKGKSYFLQIKAAYSAADFKPARVRRVVVCWVVKGLKDHENERPILTAYKSQHLGRKLNIEVLSLRDLILPELKNTIGTANYDDEILRTIGFIKHGERQTTLISKRRPPIMVPSDEVAPGPRLFNRKTSRANGL